MKSLTSDFCSTLIKTVFFSSFLVAQPSVAQTLDSSLIGAWSFDEGAGNTAADGSSEGNTGSLSGHTWEAGQQNSGVCFSGVAGQHMTATPGSVNNPDSVTLLGWVKPTSGQSKWGWIAGFGDSVGLYVEANGGLVMYFWTGSTWAAIERTQAQLGLSEQGLQDGAWHHVAGSYSPQSGFALHVDGKEIATELPAGPINYALGGEFYIGSMQGTRTFNGCLDEIELHAKALSYTEIQSYLTVDEQSVVAVNDQSLECTDSDGDGWGWNGVESCQINSVAEPIVVETTECIDSSGDGWGWNGVASCQINTVAEPVAVETTACIDSSGDGWGWNGVESCQINSVAEPIALETTACIDSSGDGWGWNGVESCQINSVSEPIAVETTACIDSSGDGWGWNGVESCIPEQSDPVIVQEDANVVVSSIEEFDLQWGDFPLIADTSDKRLFLSLGEDFASSTAMSAPLSYLYAASGYSIAIDGNPIAAGSTLSLSVQHGDVLAVDISLNDSLWDQYQLVITNLPIMQIFADSIVDEPKLPGTIRWVNGANNIDTGTMQLGIEYRGATAQRYVKKPYSFEVRDEDGKGTNVRFLDLRNDDDWIADAAYRDQSFVRNLVSHDLYRDMRSYAYINSEGEEKGQSTLAGGLAEVILNSSYHGVYVIHEKVDRKLLSLEKIDVPEDDTGDRWDLVDFTDPANGSVLYKASTEYSDFHSSSSMDNEFEQKYPDDDDIYWYQPLNELGDFIANSSDSDFNNSVASLVEFESVVDWWMLRLVTSNWDAFKKNYYPSRSETLKWTIVPWDFDATFGMDWQGGVDPTSVEFYEPTRNNLVGRLTSNPTNGFNAMAKARWTELRSSLFTADSIAARFSSYADQVDRGANVAGVSPRLRNTQRWPETGNTGAGSPELADPDYIRDWLKERLAFVDGKMNDLQE